MVYLWLDHPTDILEEKDNLELHNINDDDWINDDLLAASTNHVMSFQLLWSFILH